MSMDRQMRFPLGSQVRLEELKCNPYPILTLLQEREPVSWIAEVGSWFITRRSDTLAVLLDSSAFSVSSAQSFLEDTFGQTMLSTDGARRRQLRQPFNAAFSPKSVHQRMAEAIAEQAHLLIDRFSEEGRADLKTAFADRLALWTVMTMLGLPIHDFNTVRGWFTDIAHALGNFTRDPEVRRRGQAASAAFGAYVTPHFAQLADEPSGSVLAALVSSDQLTQEELLAAARVIVFGGLETTSAMLTNTLWALLRHPEQYEAVCASPDLLPQAIEEALRWEAPVQSCTRYATQPVVLQGVEISAGEMVQCMIGAANRDPEHFPGPDRFDLWRDNARDHLSFAIGKHFCLGAALAHLEGDVGLKILLERLVGLRLDPDLPSYPQGHEFRSPPMLAVRWEKTRG